MNVHLHRSILTGIAFIGGVAFTALAFNDPHPAVAVMGSVYLLASGFFAGVTWLEWRNS